MPRSFRMLAVLVLTPLALLSVAAFSRQAQTSLLGVWEIAAANPAPWPGGTPAPAGIIGRVISFTTETMTGPAVFQCRDAGYERVMLEPAGLFQGGLPESRAAELAAGMGLSGSAIETIRLSCDRGLFDFHVASDTVVLIAVDNAVYELHRRWQSSGAGR